MTFKWKIINPPYRQQVDGVEVCIPGVECDFETGSGNEALGVFEAEDSAFTRIFGRSPMASIDFSQVAAAPPAPGETTPEPAQRRTRGPNKPKAAVEAVAPEPLPVPALVAPPLAPTATALPPNALNGANLAIPADGSIPAFLQRAPAAPPPPLPLPTAPPVGLLGPKVVKALDLLKEGKPDGGQALSDWLAGAGLTIKGKSYDEACRAVLMISDEKITAAGILQPLGL